MGRMTSRIVSLAAPLKRQRCTRLRLHSPYITARLALACPPVSLADFSQLAQQLGYKPSQRMIEARARKADFAAAFLSDPKKRKAVCGASMYSTAHSSARWTSEQSIDVESDEYYKYEHDVGEHAFKQAKMKATAVRANFKGQGGL